MLKSTDCQKKYGSPGDVRTEGKFMMSWEVPGDIANIIPALPRRLYCNRDLVRPFEQALRNIILRGLAGEFKTWDGCYQVRRKRGQISPSLHSWGVAVDLNAAWNGFGKKPTLSAAFVDCFADAGFDWGGVWGRPDGMHFQLKSV